ncbi:hypothetical protein LIS90_13565, partial [Flavobacterium psychrophilum]
MKKILLLLLPTITFGQVNFPTVPQPTQFQNYGRPNFGIPTNPRINIQDLISDPMQNLNQEQQIQNEKLIREAQQRENQREQQMREVYRDINKSKSNINYNLPSNSDKLGTEFYRTVFDKMQILDETNYSIKDVNFQIENAFFENKLDKAEFDKIIKQSGEFIIAKMKELNYDLNSNSAKNFMLFKFFSETLQLKGFKTKHLPLKYDFEDFNGDKNWSKMFVTKLLKTGKGQCHSLPLLYLTLAEEIGATAYLALAPKHSYIKFQDENKKWYNIELTNGMFTAPSFILNNGYVRSEALQNHIYMQELSKKELLAQLYSDLAMGYIAKFGYDDFIEKIAQKALSLYPNGIVTNMLLSNFNTVRFEYAMKKLRINPNNKTELQQIRQYPETVQWLKATNEQYNKIDDLGYQDMPK